MHEELYIRKQGQYFEYLLHKNADTDTHAHFTKVDKSRIYLH